MGDGDGILVRSLTAFSRGDGEGGRYPVEGRRICRRLSLLAACGKLHHSLGHDPASCPGVSSVPTARQPRKRNSNGGTLRKRISNRIYAEAKGAISVSISTTTIVYKGMLLGYRVGPITRTSPTNASSRRLRSYTSASRPTPSRPGSSRWSSVVSPFELFEEQPPEQAILFRAVAETLRRLAADPRHLAEIGFIAVLHSWGRNLHYHPYIHCIVPGGTLSFEQSRWVASGQASSCPYGSLCIASWWTGGCGRAEPG